jgi:hypothetical protein
MRKYFDYCTHEIIEISCRCLKFPERLIALVLEMGRQASTMMITVWGLSDPEELKGSVRQGCSLSVLTAIVIISVILRFSEMHPYLFAKLAQGQEPPTLSGVSFADDTTLMSGGDGNGRQSLDANCDFCGAWSRLARLAFNGEKSTLWAYFAGRPHATDEEEAGESSDDPATRSWRIAQCPPARFHAFCRTRGLVVLVTIPASPLDKPCRHSLGCWHDGKGDSSHHDL